MNVLTVDTSASATPLFHAKIKPFVREGCSIRGVQFDYVDGSGNLLISTGYRLGETALLGVSGSTLGTRASVRDGNGLWSEYCSLVSIGESNFTSGSVEGSIGSGSLDDLHIQSPGIVLPDFSNGSGRGFLRRTLVGGSFLDQTMSEKYPKGKAVFTVKLESLCLNERQLLHRFFRSLNGNQRVFFLDYVETSSGSRTTGVSRRYLVRFRDANIADSMFGGSFSETSFTLVEVNDCPSGGDNYSDLYSPVLASIGRPNFIDTYFQFFGSDWVGETGSIVWQQIGIAGQPGQLVTTGSSAGILLYNTPPVRANQRVGIQFLAGVSGVLTGVVLRYKDSNNNVKVYLNASGSLRLAETVSGTTTTTVLLTGLTIPSTPLSMQVEIISNRLRWWFEYFQEMRDRPMDGAVDLTGTYDDVNYNNWGLFMQNAGGSIQRFTACELPGSVMPPPMLSVSLATTYDFVPIELSLSTTYPTTNQFYEWEVLPNDPADFPEPYRATSVGSSHTMFIRPGFNYMARARLVQTPWSEYLPVIVGSAGGTGWASKSQYATYWPSQDYTTGTSPVGATLTFPNIVPDYVFEGRDEGSSIVTVTNMGAEYSATGDRRTARSFTLKFDEREAADYQILLDFFDMCHAKRTPWNFTSPLTGEQFVLRFNADDYMREDRDTSSESGSAIASVAFSVIECPPLSAIIPSYTFRLQIDPSILTNPSETPSE